MEGRKGGGREEGDGGEEGRREGRGEKGGGKGGGKGEGNNCHIMKRKEHVGGAHGDQEESSNNEANGDTEVQQSQQGLH